VRAPRLAIHHMLKLTHYHRFTTTPFILPPNRLGGG
jgi:hypothetical protein